MDTFYNISGLIWDNTGNDLSSNTLYTSEDIIKRCGLDFTVSSHPMGCDIMNPVRGYHAVFRDDTNSLLGVVNTAYPKLVQNCESFIMMESLIRQSKATPVTCGQLKSGQYIFGIFTINESQCIIGDQIFKFHVIILNDHLKPDNKIQMMIIPELVNHKILIPYMFSKSEYVRRVAINHSPGFSEYISSQIFSDIFNITDALKSQINNMKAIQINSQCLQKIIDYVFPYPESEGYDDSKAVDNVDLIRSTFLEECFKPLDYYHTSVYDVYIGICRFIQHYFKDTDKGYDISYKLTLMPYISTANSRIKHIKSFQEFISNAKNLT